MLLLAHYMVIPVMSLFTLMYPIYNYDFKGIDKQNWLIGNVSGPVYRKSMLGDALCTTWTNWVNGKIVSPCRAVEQLNTKPKRSENSENLKFQEKIDFFSKHLDDSLTQKFNLQPTKPRAIRGGNSQVKTLWKTSLISLTHINLLQDQIGNSLPKEVQIFENGSLIKYQVNIVTFLLVLDLVLSFFSPELRHLKLQITINSHLHVTWFVHQNVANFVTIMENPRWFTAVTWLNM